MLSLCFSCLSEEMALPCAQNVEIMHLDFPCCLLCGFLIADVKQRWLALIGLSHKDLGQKDMEPVESELNL